MSDVEILDCFKNERRIPNIRREGGAASSSEGPSLGVPPSDMGEHFGVLLETGFGSDVVVEVEGEAFGAHKLVLAARSPVFKAQLVGPMRERNGEKLLVEEMQAPVFKAMLHFIYKDTLPDTPDLTGSSLASASTLMAQHLLAAADRYALDRLRLMCESKLSEEVSIDTVGTTLALAEQHHADQLKRVCLKFAAANLKAVMDTEGFEYLRESCPSLQAELLRTVAGVGTSSAGSEEGQPPRGRASVWSQHADGADGNNRRVRQRM